MPHLTAGRRRLLRWLVVPLAAAAAVTTVQVVHDAPGPLRTAAAGAAPELVIYNRSAGGRNYQLLSYTGERTRPTGGTARICGPDVVAAGAGRCLDFRYAVNYGSGQLTLATREAGTVQGRRLGRGSDVIFRARPVSLDPPNPGGMDEEVAIARTNIGFQHGRTLHNGRRLAYYRIWMPSNVTRPNDPPRYRTVFQDDRRFAVAVTITNEIREAARLGAVARRNAGAGVFTFGASGVAAYVAVAAGVVSAPVAVLGALLAYTVTSFFFFGPAWDAHQQRNDALRRAGNAFEDLFHLDIEGGTF